MFRDDVEPKWEHPANAKGGSWLIVLPQQARKTLVDRYWLNTVRQAFPLLHQDLLIAL